MMVPCLCYIQAVKRRMPSSKPLMNIQVSLAFDSPNEDLKETMSISSEAVGKKIIAFDCLNCNYKNFYGYYRL